MPQLLRGAWWFGALTLCLGWISPAAEAQDFRSRLRRFGYPEEAESRYSLAAEPIATAILTGAAGLRGPTPLSIPGDVRGRFRVDLIRPGFERQRATLEVPEAGRLGLRGPRRSVPGSAKFLGSLWPGLPHFWMGDGLRGTAWLGTASLAALAAGAAELRRSAAAEDASALRGRLLSSASSVERFANSRALVSAEARAHQNRRARGHWLGVTAGLWAASWLDYLFLAPGLGAAEQTDTEARFVMRPLRRGQAAWRSIVPGLGQLYAGRPRAAGWLMAGSAVAGFALLWAEHRFDERVDRLAGLEVLYADPTLDPILVDQARPWVEEALVEARDAERHRNTAMAVALGVWAYGMVDAAIGTPAVEVSARLDAAGGWMPAAGLSLKF